ncbi:atrial natriuretic peptide-converting enzyme [Nilaparvata lugens]|uniref:atrial natriuretic peptide-converting enzyme n=1 Tax=Nilaparvata lugens TaxID=108931 RepID=UPI00193D88D7|nr:atrial natriuretic peptide-converting enzyme [Nilaparvata lugens]
MIGSQFSHAFRKFNCSALSSKGVCAMYRMEKGGAGGEGLLSGWRTLRWLLLPSVVLFLLALATYCIVDVADHHSFSPDRHRYIETHSLDDLSDNRIDGDVILETDGIIQSSPSPGKDETNKSSSREENADLATSEVANSVSVSWLGDSPSGSTSAQDTTSFVDRLLLSFHRASSASTPPPPPPAYSRAISVSPFLRRRLPNGHKYGEYQASPTDSGLSRSTTRPRVSPTLPARDSPSPSTSQPQNLTTTASDGICSSPKLEACRGVLPWDLVAPAAFPGLEEAMPFLDTILDSGCSSRAREFFCSLLEPECQDAGHTVLPPCRKTCKAIAEDCSEFIIDSLNLSKIFNCDIYPDLDNPEECVNLARGDCLSNEFQCPDETCIPKRWVCDGLRDCPLGADEINCTKCSHDEFKCKSDHKCILNSWKCDGNRDCSDGSDESNCQHEMIAHVHTSPCPSDELRCVDGRCITLQQICDKIVDCADAADEANCSLPNS